MERTQTTSSVSFDDMSTTEIYTYAHTLPLHDLLTISANFGATIDIRPIGEIHPANMSRPIFTVTKQFAGARTIVVLVEALPDQVGAEPRCRLERGRAHVCTPVTYAKLV